MKIVSLLMLLLMVSGCVPLRKVKPLPETENLGNISILRDNDLSGRANRFWPTVDGEDVAGLFTSEYVSFDLPSGTHWLGVRCTNANQPHYELEVETAAEKRRYFRITHSFATSCKIKEISESEALGMIGHFDRIKTGYISDCERKSVLYKDASLLCPSLWGP